TIHLLQAVEQRIRAAVDQLGPQLDARAPAVAAPAPASSAPLNGVPAYAGPSFAQNDVDALLRDLGI
ncbi:MAG: protein phosphatase CheZ, partial [Thiomonas sp.]